MNTISWQHRFEHDRDVQLAQCRSQGMAEPPVERYGTLVRLPDLFKKFDGKTFWEEMKKLGHDRMDVAGCSCLRSDPKGAWLGNQQKEQPS